VFDGLMDEFEGSEDFNPAEWMHYSSFYMVYFIRNYGIKACSTVIETKEAKNLLEMIKTVEFDVIVHGITLVECLFGLWEVAKGKPPVVGFVPFGFTPWLKDYIGGPNYPTVQPYPHTAKPIGFWQKIWNALYYVADDLMRHYYYLPIIQRHTAKYIGHATRPLYEIERDSINIVLINSHPTFDYGIPLPPNTLEIAGLNAQIVQPITGEVVVTYPENMRTFLEGARNGAIVISLGTRVKWKAIGIDKIKIVILAVSKLKQRVLWKLDIKVPFEIPDNLMIVKWIPQNEILCT
ncbi:PREDICTED: UDP-glucuronosyltransferase 2B19-like, partial [Wasmannia auropunctata]|uniref:UDP-glucuronosyltransferase 2B19-like n=1 Tax=Wasmannia auropunctata TaxID=64793 RepID=UPI0005EDA6F8